MLLFVSRHNEADLMRLVADEKQKMEREKMLLEDQLAEV